MAQAQTAPQLLPYTSKLIAGGGKTATFSVGETCPVSGYTATDTYGDGCLGTEVELSGARYAIADASGNVFLSDWGNGLVRRVDAVTGVITIVAGGASSSPSKATACGAYTSTDALGDGCLGTAVQLGEPAGLAFDASGDLYFADPNHHNIRMIAATSGLIPATGGVIALVDGETGGLNDSTYGYEANSGSLTNCTTPNTCIVAATQGLLDGPYGIFMDSNGNLYVPDQYTTALLVINTSSTVQTVTGISIPPGTIAKIVGSSGGGSTSCTNGTSGDGCGYGQYVNGASASASEVDYPWAAAADPSGNVYLSPEYYDDIAVINAAGIINNFSGEENSIGKNLLNTKRATAGTFATGASLGLAADSYGNVYVPDLTNGFVWRVDGVGKSMYVVAGGGSGGCTSPAGTGDTLGDGCPALDAKFGASGTYGSATTALGLYGVTVDAYADLFVADPPNNLVREVASGTQFGVIGANEPTDIVEIHFAAGDSPATSSPYLLTAGASNFSLGKATCTTNSDNTTDCLLPITATPTALGLFTGTLSVTSQLGGISNFPLSGTYAESPSTRLGVAFTTQLSCSTSTSFASGTSITLSATLTANGPSAPTGTVTFYANGTQIGTPQNVVNLGTALTPVYGATLTTSLSTLNTYTFTATYSGDSYFHTSSGSASSQITIAQPTFTTSATPSAQSTVAAGQTGLYSFNIVQTAYSGNIAFACSGLPANASCVFSPQSITASGCSTTNIVALSILTQQGSAASAASIGLGGRGPWQLLCMMAGFGLALLIGIRRRRVSGRLSQLLLVLALLVASCGVFACNSATVVPATPAGSYTIKVTLTGSSGGTLSFTVPFTVN